VLPSARRSLPVRSCAPRTMWSTPSSSATSTMTRLGSP